MFSPSLRLACAVTLLLSLWPVAPILAQAQAVRVSVAPVEVSRFPELQTTVVVLNNSGVPITGLTAANFEVLEDGTSLPVGAIDQVAANQAGVAVVLGLDVSGSMQGQPLADAGAAITALVDRLSTDDQVGAVSFGGASCEVSRGPGFADGRTDVKGYVTAAKAEGDTPLYDATLAAVQQALTASPGRRMVVMLTDGEDTCSKTSADTAVAVAAANGIPLYFIGLGPNLKAAELQRLAGATGGQYLPADDSSKLAAIYEALLTRLRTQYTLRYASAQYADRRQHALEVRVKTETGEATSKQIFTPPILPVQLKLSFSANQPLTGPTRVEVGPTARVRLARAEFYLDGTLLQRVEQPPFAYTLDPAGLTGSHTLLVRATDTGGGEGEATSAVEMAGSPIQPYWYVAAVLLLPILFVGSIFQFGRRRHGRCPTCGRKMEARWANCPYCASQAVAPAMSAPLLPGQVPTAGEPEPMLGESASTWASREKAPAPIAPSGEAGDGEGHAKTVILNAPAQPAAWLVVKAGTHAGTYFRLGDGETSIGRDGANDIVLDDDAVSRQHARVRRLKDAFIIADLDSANHTRVNGKPVSRQELREGDEIGVGETVLVFVSPSEGGDALRRSTRTEVILQTEKEAGDDRPDA